MSRITVPVRKGQEAGGSLLTGSYHQSQNSLSPQSANQQIQQLYKSDNSSQNGLNNNPYISSQALLTPVQPTQTYQNFHPSYQSPQFQPNQQPTGPQLDIINETPQEYSGRDSPSSQQYAISSNVNHGANDNKNYRRDRSLDSHANERSTRDRPFRPRNKSEDQGLTQTSLSRLDEYDTQNSETGNRTNPTSSRLAYMGNVAKSLKDKAGSAAVQWTSRAVTAGIELSKQASSTAQSQYQKWKDNTSENYQGNLYLQPGQSPFNIFGERLQYVVERTRIDPEYPVPSVITRCILYVECHALEEVGVYRLSGSTATVGQLKAIFNQYGDCDDLEDRVDDPHAVSSLLKMFLRELPEHILTEKLKGEFNKVASMQNQSPNLQSTQNAVNAADQDWPSCDPQAMAQIRHLISCLPAENHALLAVLCRHLSRIAAMSETNKMTILNLQLIFSQTLLVNSMLLKVFIEEWESLFAYSYTKPAEVNAPQFVEVNNVPQSINKSTPPIRSRSLTRDSSLRDRDRSKSRDKLSKGQPEKIENNVSAATFKSIGTDGTVLKNIVRAGGSPVIPPRQPDSGNNRLMVDVSNTPGEKALGFKRSIKELRAYFDGKSESKHPVQPSQEVIQGTFSQMQPQQSQTNQVSADPQFILQNVAGQTQQTPAVPVKPPRKINAPALSGAQLNNHNGTFSQVSAENKQVSQPSKIVIGARKSSMTALSPASPPDPSTKAWVEQALPQAAPLSPLLDSFTFELPLLAPTKSTNLSETSKDKAEVGKTSSGDADDASKNKTPVLEGEEGETLPKPEVTKPIPSLTKLGAKIPVPERITSRLPENRILIDQAGQITAGYNKSPEPDSSAESAQPSVRSLMESLNLKMAQTEKPRNQQEIITTGLNPTNNSIVQQKNTVIGETELIAKHNPFGPKIMQEVFSSDSDTFSATTTGSNKP